MTKNKKPRYLMVRGTFNSVVVFENCALKDLALRDTGRIKPHAPYPTSLQRAHRHLWATTPQYNNITWLEFHLFNCSGLALMGIGWMEPLTR